MTDAPEKNQLDAHVAAYRGGNLYDFDNEILLTWYPQRILQRAYGAASVLELGLGHGFSTNAFARAFPRLVVLEGSPAVIANFRERFPECRAEIVETLFEEYSAPELYDLIIMGFILEHVEDPQALLLRYRRLLAPGGRIFLAVPNAEVLNRRLGHLAGMLDDVRALAAHDLALGHKRYYTVASLEDEIARGGYVVVRMEGIYLKPFTTSQILSLQLDRRVIDALCQVGVAYPELSCGILAEISVP